MAANYVTWFLAQLHHRGQLHTTLSAYTLLSLRFCPFLKSFGTYYRAERQKLHRHMVNKMRSEQLAQLGRAVKKFAEVREELRCVYADVDLNVLKKAQVVGMTTNEVASKQELVAAMGSKVTSSAY